METPEDSLRMWFWAVQEGSEITQRMAKSSDQRQSQGWWSVSSPEYAEIDISRILVGALLEESVGPLEQVRPVLASSNDPSREVTFRRNRKSGDENLDVTSSPENIGTRNYSNPGRNLFNRLRSAHWVVEQVQRRSDDLHQKWCFGEAGRQNLSSGFSKTPLCCR